MIVVLFKKWHITKLNVQFGIRKTMQIMICQTQCDTSQLEKRETIYHKIFTKRRDRDEKRRQREGWINKWRKGMGVGKAEEGVIMMHA